MIVDYHLHTKASPDGSGDFADFIKEALKKRICEIGFSEHMMDYPHRSMNFMDEYVERFLETKRDSKVPLKLGAEMDFSPEEIDNIRQLLQKYPFDYVIGSVHYLGNWSIDSPSQMHEYFKRNTLEVYTEYFEVVERLCRTRLFDILGHADIVKIFGFRPDCDINQILLKTAEVIAESEMCVEINTSGLERRCAEIYPGKEFLTLLGERDVPVTLGSDAHRPQDVGRRFDEALDLMREVGITHICTFKARERKMTEIP